ncbi:MAG: thiol:disulfide interchange protein DsbA/DsbL [Gammaproteobacteria bacterium]|nr:thiol:disulfide interchange protein DsbA/DsbL [Gammaproteobacteria bacterium]
MPPCNRTWMTARTLACAWSALILMLSGPALAGAPEEGKNFNTLTPPQPTSQSSRIEVVEFFSYGCPHCAHFSPMLNAWVAKLPPDVLFRRVPVSFNRDPWVNLQRTYYALESTGDLARLDGALFHALHQERKPLYDESALADWVGHNGGDAERFTTAYTSLAVNKQSFQADQMAQDYRIAGVPALAIDGRYVAHVAEGTTDEDLAMQELLESADALIARERGERAPAKAVAPQAK